MNPGVEKQSIRYPTLYNDVAAELASWNNLSLFLTHRMYRSQATHVAEARGHIIS